MDLTLAHVYFMYIHEFIRTYAYIHMYACTCACVDAHMLSRTHVYSDIYCIGRLRHTHARLSTCVHALCLYRRAQTLSTSTASQTRTSHRTQNFRETQRKTWFRYHVHAREHAYIHTVACMHSCSCTYAHMYNICVRVAMRMDTHAQRETRAFKSPANYMKNHTASQQGVLKHAFTRHSVHF